MQSCLNCFLCNIFHIHELFYMGNLTIIINTLQLTSPISHHRLHTPFDQACKFYKLLQYLTNYKIILPCHCPPIYGHSRIRGISISKSDYISGNVLHSNNLGLTCYILKTLQVMTQTTNFTPAPSICPDVLANKQSSHISVLSHNQSKT